MSEEKKDKKMFTPVGRIAFTKNLTTVSDDDRPKYKLTLIFDKDEDLSGVHKMMMESAKTKFKKEEVMSKKFKWGVKVEDGESEIDFLEEGVQVINANRNGDFSAPVILGQTKGERLTEADFKAGDYFRALISSYPYEYKGKKGVALNFDGIQFVKEGEAFYKRVEIDSFFEEAGFLEEATDEDFMKDMAESMKNIEEPTDDDGW